MQHGLAIARALARATSALPATSATPRLDAEILLAQVLGWSRARLLAHAREPLAPDSARSFATLVERRLAGEPIAYLTGKRFGSRRLAPNVSPGKTWEGALGGAALAGGACIGALAFAGVADWAWVAITLVLIAVSIVGDLMESLLKRASGVKDSGSLLPGHGGVLDRIDSALPVLPAFAVILGGQ